MATTITKPSPSSVDRTRTGHSGGAALVEQRARSAATTSAVKGDIAPAPLAPAQKSSVTQALTSSRVLKPPPFDPKQPADTQLVVAGAGIGGGALARLAEQGFEVTFLEAGPPQRDWFCDVPALIGKVSDDTFTVDGYSPPMALAEYFVQHYEEAQKNADLKMHEEMGGIFYPRGQGPGGSGNVNANVAVAPDKSSLEALYVHSGKDPRFSPANMEAMFARAQDPAPLFKFLECMGHVLTTSQKLGVKDFARLTEPGGWQQIHRATDFVGLKDAIKDPQLIKITLHILAFTAKTHSFGDLMARIFSLFDSNNEINHGREGFTLMPISVTKDGRRSSVADRLKAVMRTRPDTMKLECETKVHSLIFNDKGTRVEGVRVLKPNAEVRKQRELIYALQQNVPNVAAGEVDAYNARIADEIAKLHELEATTQPEMEIKRASDGYVLSAGTFEDPMVLIRSGYGPKEVLDRLGIPPVGGVYHEGVGRNLKDRREITMMFHAKDAFSLVKGLGFGKNPHDDAAMQVWEKSGRGAYATNGVVASYQFKSDPSKPDADIFAFFVPGVFRGYDLGYSTESDTYPQTFTAVLLDKNGDTIFDGNKPLDPAQYDDLRKKLGTVEPDPADPTMMKQKINFNIARPKPGEDPPLYAAMVRMRELFAGVSDVLTEMVPADPFAAMPSTSMKDALSFVETADLFPGGFAKDDVRSRYEDWFTTMDVPLYGKDGGEHALTLNREGNPRLLVDGKPASVEKLAGLTLFGGKPLTPASLKGALERQWMIEFEHSQQWGHHANGTASMGTDPKNDVIGPDFRVWGPDGQPVENLWLSSMSGTPAAANPGPFVQLYMAGVAEAASDAIGEQMRANENHLGRMSPLATRLPAAQSKKNTLGEDLLIAVDRARGHLGDREGVLTGEALAQLIAIHKDQGFSKADVKLAEDVVERAQKSADQNTPILKVLASEVRKLRQDQGFALDVRAALRRNKDHLRNDEVLRILDEVAARERDGATGAGGG